MLKIHWNKRKVFSVKRTIEILFIGPTVQPRSWHFRFWSACEAKALECLASGKGAPSLTAHARQRWHGADESTSPWKRSCLKEPEGEATPKARLSHRRAFCLKARLPQRQACFSPRRGYSSLEAGLKYSSKGEVEFNHQGEAQTHISVILNLSNLKYFEIWTIPLQIYENFEGVLWHSKKTNSRTAFQLAKTMSNLSTFTKDKSRTSWRPVQLIPRDKAET